MHIIFIILLCFVVTGFILNFRFVSYLKERHYEIWKELGEPSIINSSIKNNTNVIKFLASKGYLDINDKTLTKMAKFLYGFNRVYIVTFIVFVIFVGFYIIRGK